jgi:hypothetical protein
MHETGLMHRWPESLKSRGEHFCYVHTVETFKIKLICGSSEPFRAIEKISLKTIDIKSILFIPIYINFY